MNCFGASPWEETGAELREQILSVDAGDIVVWEGYTCRHQYVRKENERKWLCSVSNGFWRDCNQSLIPIHQLTPLSMEQLETGISFSLRCKWGIEFFWIVSLVLIMFRFLVLGGGKHQSVPALQSVTNLMLSLVHLVYLATRCNCQ